MEIDKKITIEIDGKQVDLRINKYAAVLYRWHYRRDLNRMITKFAEALVNGENLDTKTLERLAQGVWAFAKSANPTIPKFNKWFDEFEVFHVRDIFSQILDTLEKDVKEHGK